MIHAVFYVYMFFEKGNYSLQHNIMKDISLEIFYY